MVTIKQIIKYNLWLSALIAILFVLLIIPIAMSLLDTENTVTPEGSFVRSGNRVFYNFLDDVKKEDGLVVFGTSETFDSLNGNNYYCLLDRDEEFKHSVYTFGGAGRTSNMYFPHILNAPETFKDLNVMYYINPTYWRTNLNHFNAVYYNRYVDSLLVERIKPIAKEKGLYEQFMYHSEYSSSFKHSLDHQLDHYKSYFYYDLVDLISPFQEDHKKEGIMEEFIDPEELKSKINLEYNATDEIIAIDDPFHKIDTVSTYQYEVLKAFIKLTKEYEINCTFYLGPYNKIYGQKVNPEFLDDYPPLLENIRNILISEEVNFIDGTDISNIPGTFIDSQHISEYGAYLTALKIKKHYEKRN